MRLNKSIKYFSYCFLLEESIMVMPDILSLDSIINQICCWLICIPKSSSATLCSINGMVNANVAPLPPSSLVLFLAHMLPPWDSIIFLDMNTPIQRLDKILRQTLKNNLGKISLSIPVPLSVILTISPVFQLFFSFLH